LNTIPRDHPIIVFDGVCVLCTANAQFVLSADKIGRFRLAAMQGEVGAALMRENGIDPLDPESFVLIDAQHDGGWVWTDSDAVLHLWSELGWPYRMGVVFRLIPRFVRDPIYRLIARNRYKWFGKREECWVPSRDQLTRLL
jgi:predicted DCC family thiol-disulfide oxidoreductase YuxK